jgi:hypothetical protein
MKNRKTIFTAIPLAISCLALLPIARAVSPAPDGGYPGYNTAKGQNALLNRTTGLWNTALGAFTLYGDTTNGNTAVGINALRHNLIAGFNTALGLNALFLPMTPPAMVSALTTRPLEAMRFFPIPTAGATPPLVQTRCLSTRQPTETRPSVATRSVSILATPTRPSVMRRSLTIPTELRTLPLAHRRSRATSTAASTRLLAVKHCLRITVAAQTLLLV